MKRFANAVFMTIIFVAAAFAQTTAFRYQGSLTNAGMQASGNYDFEFLLYDALSGGAQIGMTQSVSNVEIANGRFSVELDFGNQFPGANRFLEIHVRQSGGGAFTPLAPRQAITSAPYSVKSVNAETAAFATNSLQLGGVAANQYVGTNDPRMTDARNPLPNSSNYVQNQNAVPQASGNFNISGIGTANILTASVQFNIGANRILANPGTNNLFAGLNAGAVNTGNRNSFFGDSAGAANTSGGSNTFVGGFAGQSTTFGSNNSFFGGSAGLSNIGGDSNSFFGSGAGSSFANASRNSFFGVGAGLGVQGASGGDNSFFGFQAGRTISSGQNNSMFGLQAGQDNQTGSFNSFFGSSVGASSANLSNNTLIGANSDGAAGVTNSTALGFRAKVTQSNSLVLGSINGVNGATANTKVGIGTTTPVAPLEVVGDWTGTEGALRLTGDRPTVRFTGGAAAGNQSWILHLGSNIPGELGFYRPCGAGCWTQTLTMSPAGNVGINVTPLYGLHVVTATNQGLRVQTDSTGGTIASFGGNGAFDIDAPNVPGGRFRVHDGGGVMIGPRTSGIASHELFVQGKGYFNGTMDLAPSSSGTQSICIKQAVVNPVWQLAFCSSSLRYKKDIQTFGNGMNIIRRLRPISFTWKGDDGSPDIGLAAEEVEKVEPLLTFRNGKGEIEGVRYDQLSPIFINAFKEQQAQIEEQKEQLEKQQQQIDALKGLVCQQNPGAEICREGK